MQIVPGLLNVDMAEQGLINVKHESLDLLIELFCFNRSSVLLSEHIHCTLIHEGHVLTSLLNLDDAFLDVVVEFGLREKLCAQIDRVEHQVAAVHRNSRDK